LRRFVSVAALAVAGVGALAATAAALPRAGETFAVERNGYLVGQAPDWLDAGHVVFFHDPFLRDDGSDGQIQIHRATLRGKRRTCLTCGLDGPNQVPVIQPGGRWILFHSWNGHHVRLGGAGFGGIGSDVWVMTRGGRRRTNLTDKGELHGARRLWLSLHRDRRHRHQPRALLLPPARPRPRPLPAVSPDAQPRLG
jgi:hypothetical protein